MLYSLKDVAKAFSLSDRKMRYLIKDGILKGQKINGKWFFTNEQIVEFGAREEIMPNISFKMSSAIDKLFSEDTVMTDEEPKIIILCRFPRAVEKSYKYDVKMRMEAITNMNIDCTSMIIGEDIITYASGKYNDLIDFNNKLFECYNSYRKTAEEESV